MSHDYFDGGRMVKAVRGLPDFIDELRRDYVTRTLPANVPALTEAEADAALLQAIAKRITRAAQTPGARVGAVDVVHGLYPGEDVIVLRMADGWAVGLVAPAAPGKGKG